MPLRNSDYIAAGLAGLAAFAVYLRTLPPTVTGEDSGEFIAAAYALGVPHPPGYPLWCMLAHPFTYIPCGEVAWRVHLMTAGFGAATVAMTALLILLMTRNRLAAVGGALALAFSRQLWEQSLIAEVYSLNAFLVALCLFILWRWHATRRNGLLLWLAVVYGLSLGNHNTMVLAGPLFAAFVVAVEAAPIKRAKVYAGLGLLAAVCAFLVYLYLPLRSMANPPIDWGNPETFSNFRDVVLRKQFAFMLHENPRSLARFAGQMAVMTGFWAREFTFFGALFAFFGFAVLLRRRFWYAMHLAALALVVVTGFTLIQNFSLDLEWRWVMRVFGIPAYLVTALCIGAGLDAVYRFRPMTRYLAATLAFLLILLPFAAHYHDNDKSGYYWAREYAENVLGSMAPDAIFIPEADHAAFPALYLQMVEGFRTDITIGRKYGYVDLGIVPGFPEERRQEIGEFPYRRYEPEIFAWLLEHDPRPVYFSRPPRLPKSLGIRFVPAGLVFRALRPGEEDIPHDYWAEYTWRGLDQDLQWPHSTPPNDYTIRLILLEIAMARTREDFQAGEFDAGIARLEEALGLYGRDVTSLNNAGVLCARHGLDAPARNYFTEALRHDPTNPAVTQNLQRLR
jgi:hypothetical protein